ncbi:MAG TPA: TolC family protein [Bryobacteraceae bacterium]|nr:TolC family protein [Bryobacteraceae bacterium]
MRYVVLCALASVAAWGQPLRLEDVLNSVQRHYPPLQAAMQEQAIADAERLQAEGRFDFVARGRWDSDTLGYYENRRWDVGIEQPTTILGMSLLAGYRLGEGSYAPYDGKLDTRSGGEWRTGLRLPLLRDRAIDSRRADLAKTKAGQAVARFSIETQRLGITLAAARRYWDWVAAGRRLELAQAVLRIARDRQAFLDGSVAGGLLPAIDATDNKRAVLQRQGQVIEAERLVQQTAIELSLFYRDERGSPLIPSPEQLPSGFPVPENLDGASVEAEIRRAASRRPDLPRLEAQRAQIEVDRQLARNTRLPAVDVIAGFTAESGSGPVRRGPQEFKAGINFELPWQRRSADGRIRAAEARIEQIRKREQFTAEVVTSEVRDAASAVRTAFDRLSTAREEVEISRKLEDAERTRFELGEGTLFQLNLRELATVESVQREITASADYQRAIAAYRTAAGDTP